MSDSQAQSAEEELAASPRGVGVPETSGGTPVGELRPDLKTRVTLGSSGKINPAPDEVLVFDLDDVRLAL